LGTGIDPLTAGYFSGTGHVTGLARRDNLAAGEYATG